MWWNRKDETASSASSKTSRGQRSKKSKSNANRRRRGGRGGDKVASTNKTASPNSLEDQNMHTLETISGIEVSLSQEVIEQKMGFESSTVSLKEELALRRRVHRAQFCVSRWPVMENHKIDSPRDSLSSGAHRVPLSGGKSMVVKSSYDNVLFLLRCQGIVDEVTCVREELVKMNSEIKALDEDRAKLERRSLNLPEEKENGCVNFWDIHRLLTSKQTNLSQGERVKLQEKRGLSLTVSFHNQQAQEAFLSKCGLKASALKTCKKMGRGNVVTITPGNCREGGAAATIQHICLLKGSSESAFFISRDATKSYNWGHVPEKLFRRMQSTGMDPKHTTDNLVYLSSGPLGAYFAEFRSGECWWGCPAEDDDFHSICSEWDVYRVVFGGCTILDQTHTVTSWIILGRDGRVAWKNLPARLHNILENRLASEAAPSEVALGSGGSYFVRFLDKTIDFCLPAHIAEVCQKLNKQGADITSVSLHPLLSHDFVIRHQ